MPDAGAVGRQGQDPGVVRAARHLAAVLRGRGDRRLAADRPLPRRGSAAGGESSSSKRSSARSPRRCARVPSPHLFVGRGRKRRPRTTALHLRKHRRPCGTGAFAAARAYAIHGLVLRSADPGGPAGRRGARLCRFRRAADHAAGADRLHADLGRHPGDELDRPAGERAAAAAGGAPGEGRRGRAADGGRGADHAARRDAAAGGRCGDHEARAQRHHPGGGAGAAVGLALPGHHLRGRAGWASAR